MFTRRLQGTQFPKRSIPVFSTHFKCELFASLYCLSSSLPCLGPFFLFFSPTRTVAADLDLVAEDLQLIFNYFFKQTCHRVLNQNTLSHISVSQSGLLRRIA